VPETDLPESATSRARFRRWLAETHGRSLPGLVWLLVSRIGALLIILSAYSWFRKTYFQRPAELAYSHARDVIALQDRLGLSVYDVEIRLQQWVLGHPPLIDFFNAYYRQFKPALYISAALCLLLAPAGFRRVRRVFLIATLIALPWYALYPLAPPRLMGEYGFNFVDTLAVFGGVHSSADGAGGANQFAAMPSMHIGWTTVAAMWLAAALPWRRVGLLIGGLHVTLMCLTVMVTGNHYWLDVAGGFLVAGTAWLVARSLPDRLPGLAWLARRSTVAPHPVPVAGSRPRGDEMPSARRTEPVRSAQRPATRR
jgi:membrane-associated phospholipid phosphatase